jgi:hypothetical protein
MRQINSLKSILNSITDKYKIDDDQKYLKFLKFWQKKIPQHIQNAIKPRKIISEILYIDVINNTWKQIILVEKSKFVQLINKNTESHFQDIIIE